MKRKEKGGGRRYRKNGGIKEGKNGEKKKIKKNNAIWKKVGTDSGKHGKLRTKKWVI